MSKGVKIWIWTIVIMNLLGQYARFFVHLPIFLVNAGVTSISVPLCLASLSVLFAWIPIADFLTALSVLYLHHCIYERQ